MSDTWTDRLRARVTELDAQIATLSMERAEIARMLGERRGDEFVSRTRKLVDLFADGQPHNLVDAMCSLGFSHKSCVGNSAVRKQSGRHWERVSRGVWRMLPEDTK